MVAQALVGIDVGGTTIKGLRVDGLGVVERRESVATAMRSSRPSLRLRANW
jgi:predicted NBD/HSP70 family sugar kinase